MNKKPPQIEAQKLITEIEKPHTYRNYVAEEKC
jgi:hypothetical protein